MKFQIARVNLAKALRVLDPVARARAGITVPSAPAGPSAMSPHAPLAQHERGIPMQAPESALPVQQAIQLSVAPVFLLTGIAGLFEATDEGRCR